MSDLAVWRAIAEREEMDRVPPVAGVHEHVDSGWRCLVDHGPGHGQCWKCSLCHEWIPA